MGCCIRLQPELPSHRIRIRTGSGDERDESGSDFSEALGFRFRGGAVTNTMAQATASAGRSKRLALACLAPVFAIGVLELVGRLLGLAPFIPEPISPGFFGDKLYDTVVREGVSYRTILPSKERQLDTIVRQVSFTAAKPPGTYRIFCVGGSTVYGDGVEESEAFPALLQKILPERFPPRRFEVINAGTCGYGTARTLNVVREVLDYSPDALVIYALNNEVLDKAAAKKFDSWRWRLARRARFLSGLRSLSLLAWAVERILPLSPPTVREVSEAERCEMLDRFRENMATMVREAKARGVAVVLCTGAVNFKEKGLSPDQVTRGRARVFSAEPDPRTKLREYEADPQPYDRYYGMAVCYEALREADKAREYYLKAIEYDPYPLRVTPSENRAIRKLARQEGVLLADIEQAISKLSPGGIVGFEYLPDNCHFNPAGHRVAAEEIAKALAPLLGGTVRAK